MIPPVTEAEHPGVCLGHPALEVWRDKGGSQPSGGAFAEAWGAGALCHSTRHKHGCPCAPIRQRDLIFCACYNANVFLMELGDLLHPYV